MVCVFIWDVCLYLVYMCVHIWCVYMRCMVYTFLHMGCMLYIWCVCIWSARCIWYVCVYGVHGVNRVCVYGVRCCVCTCCAYMGCMCVYTWCVCVLRYACLYMVCMSIYGVFIYSVFIVVFVYMWRCAYVYTCKLTYLHYTLL